MPKSSKPKYLGPIDRLEFQKESLYDVLRDVASFIQDKNLDIQVENVLINEEIEYMVWHVTVYFRKWEERKP